MASIETNIIIDKSSRAKEKIVIQPLKLNNNGFVHNAKLQSIAGQLDRIQGTMNFTDLTATEIKLQVSDNNVNIESSVTDNIGLKIWIEYYKFKT